MKIYIFDIDNTIYSSKQKTILPQTTQLINQLAQQPGSILGYATGRGDAKLEVIKEIEHLFQIKIKINGALVYVNDQLIYDNPLDNEKVKKLLADAEREKLSVGLVGKTDEVVTLINQHVLDSYVSFNNHLPKVDSQYHLTNAIYQMWIYNSNEKITQAFLQKYPDFELYRWHQGGYDITSPFNSKGKAITLIKNKFKDYRLICMGDGHNDVEMIKLADIGIGVSGGNHELLKVADLIAPKVEEDKIYDFFLQNDLL